MEFTSVKEANTWASEKGAEISSRLNVKILPIVLPFKENDYAIGFLKMPSRQIKMQAISTLLKQGKIDAGMILLNHALVKDESDSRILNDNPEYDDLYTGAVLATNGLLSISVDQYEELKKN